VNIRGAQHNTAQKNLRHQVETALPLPSIYFSLIVCILLSCTISETAIPLFFVDLGLKGLGSQPRRKVPFFIPALQSAEKLEILDEREGHEFQWLRKNSPSYLFLGGAAVYRCGKRAFRS
jgi:hypothetical protein